MESRKLVRKRTMTLTWDGLPDDDDEFFEPCNSISSFSPADLPSSDEDYDDCRVSLPSAASSVHQPTQPPSAASSVHQPTQPPSAASSVHQPTQPPSAASSVHQPTQPPASAMVPDYNIWMASPGSIEQRRERLFEGMGLSAARELLSFKHVHIPITPPPHVTEPVRKSDSDKEDCSKSDDLSHDLSNSPPLSFGGSRSDGEIESLSIEKKRKEQFLGSISKQSLTRTLSLIATPIAKSYPASKETTAKASPKRNNGNNTVPTCPKTNFDAGAAFCLIKNLDTGKEFVVNEYGRDGTWNKLSDIQTGKQLTMEEFEKSVGTSPVVKELMSRESAANPTMNHHGNDKKINSRISKSLKVSKKKGAAVLKSIKEVAISMTSRGDKEKENSTSMDHQKNAKNGNNNNNPWVKVRQTGKSFKELSALHICQEIQAHEGSIWTMKFSTDARFLASAGEDRKIKVWEVQECEVMSTNEGFSPPLRHSSQDQPPLSEDKKKKGKGTGSSKKTNQIPSYVHVPETVFSLGDRPICSFKGHGDDVLDLSWSRSQQLLSSSMDKTVRLWDLETKSCLKLFSHNDYVTCIHFNPTDDDYFISGSLDTKVRIWDVPNRQVVDWTDLNEMVTAACYTPDGQRAIIGTHTGSCRLYSTDDCRLTQLAQVTIQNKKKTNTKKITGFQYCPISPTELIVTSADSQIRVLDGSEVFFKFKGLKNTNSQIAASYTSDGTYVVSASEDSQVFVWRCEEPRHTGSGKRTVITARGHEHFPCKDVSVAIPWPCTFKTESPGAISHSKRHSKRSESPNEEYNNNNKTCLPLPPLPKKKNNNIGSIMTLREEEGEIVDSPLTMSRSATVSSTSSLSSSASNRSTCSTTYGDSPSSTPSSSWSWVGVGGHGHHAAAWGLVIVTATLGGEIRIYQNFGLPRRVGRL